MTLDLQRRLKPKEITGYQLLHVGSNDIRSPKEIETATALRQATRPVCDSRSNDIRSPKEIETPIGNGWQAANHVPMTLDLQRRLKH